MKIDNVSDFFQSSKQREEAYKRLQSSGNGGNNGSMETRVVKLESDVEYIKQDIAEIRKDVREIKRDARNDFRLLFGAIIVTALGLASLMAKGFGWM